MGTVKPWGNFTTYIGKPRRALKKIKFRTPHRSRHARNLESPTPTDKFAEDWWFASIAIPLLAATIGPFANVLSIAALVGYWREDLIAPGTTGPLLADLDGYPYKDPKWVLGLNAASLATGYAGNFFLFCNFTRRIRYMIALPASIFLWFFSAFVLVAITIALAATEPPIRPDQTFTQAYWYAVIAAVLYSLCSIMLMANMLGYFWGHYEQHFYLTEAQQTLILQTFLFFVWLAGGAGIFQVVEKDWDYSTALYFCDVTILTIGFGDVTPKDSVGRGLIIPYALGGIVFLGLMISSISNFVKELGHKNIVRAKFEKDRIRTLERSNTLSLERETTIRHQLQFPRSSIRASTGDNPEMAPRQIRFLSHAKPERPKEKERRLSLGILAEEKDRFNAMRRIQEDNAKFKKYTTLFSSIVAFIFLWIIGAVVFWQVERTKSSGTINTFFDALYFCYVSLLTIGYGDYTPESSAGRPFFVVWSLFAVPSVTILVSAAGNTVIDTFNKRTNKFAEFTLLPKHGIWREFLTRRVPWLVQAVDRRAQRKKEKKRVEEGFRIGPDPEAEIREIEQEIIPATLDDLLEEEKKPPSQHVLARELALAIRTTADDLKHESQKRYNYEEWVKFTELIKFSSKLIVEEMQDSLEDTGLIEWDWIGEDSPMMADQSEPEWLLDRLCESMTRYIRHQMPEEGREWERTVVGSEEEAVPSGSSGSSQEKEKMKDAGRKLDAIAEPVDVEEKLDNGVWQRPPRWRSSNEEDSVDEDEIAPRDFVPAH